jgi:hypothetical protein
MKIIHVYLSLFLLVLSLTITAQKNKTVEILYFKAQLACCKAKACNALESDLKSIIETAYTDGSVVFVDVKLAEENNKELIEKYNAKSQTVIIRKQKKKKEVYEDVSALVKEYLLDKDKLKLEEKMKASIEKMKGK